MGENKDIFALDCFHSVGRLYGLVCVALVTLYGRVIAARFSISEKANAPMPLMPSPTTRLVAAEAADFQGASVS